MRTLVTFMVALGLLVSGALAPGAARADDGKKAGGASEGWIYEVRVVRVDPSSAEASEAGSPFPQLESTTIALPWSEILARLKKRGATRVLMDTRITARTGTQSTAMEESSVPIVALNFQDRNNEQYRSQMIRQGCTFKQT